MNKAVHTLIIATLVSLAACWATASRAQHGPPGGLSVNVENTPLPVTGSLDVSGAVPLAPGASVTLAPGTSVTINNSAVNPVRVRDVNDANQPIAASTTCDSPAATIGCGPAMIYTVPAGKRLVIEYASLDGCILPGQSVELSVSTQLNGAFTRHAVNIAPPAAGPGVGVIACNIPNASSITAIGQQIRLYADGGTQVLVEGDRNSNLGLASFSFSISGYLVDVPLM